MCVVNSGSWDRAISSRPRKRVPSKAMKSASSANGAANAWLLPAFALWIGFEWSLVHTGAGQAALAWSRDMLGSRGGELLRRALALAFFAATALWLHRREHRMADLMGLQRPNGWVMGLLLIVAGNVLAFLLRVAMKVAE